MNATENVVLYIQVESSTYISVFFRFITSTGMFAIDFTIFTSSLDLIYSHVNLDVLQKIIFCAVSSDFYSQLLKHEIENNILPYDSEEKFVETGLL